MSEQFREWLAFVPWLDEQTALIILGALGLVILVWLIGRGMKRRAPSAPAEGDLRVLLADIAGELRESASSTLLSHFARDLGAAGRQPRIAIIRHPELIGVEDETGQVDLDEPDDAEINKARRGEDADLLVWGRARLDDGTVTMRFAPVAATGDTGNPTRFSPSAITIPYAELSIGPGAILSTAVLGSVARLARERGLTLGGQLKPLVERLQAVTRGQARELPEQCRYDALRALAWGWLTLGMETDDIELMAQAADTYKELLRFDRKDSKPEEDAELRLNFAAASLAVGEARDDAEAMQDAVESALIALQTFDPENHLSEWVFLQDRFARASAWLGVQKDDAGELTDAVAAFRNVLGVWRADTAPALWAAAQHRLADTLAALGSRSVGTQSLEQAAGAYREALQNGDEAGSANDRTVLRRGLSQVLTQLGTRLGQPERHEEAIQALQFLERPVEPGTPGVSDPETKRALGAASLALASTSQDPLDMAKAARALRDATAMMPQGPMTLGWSETHRDLGTALAALGSQRRRKPLLRDAVGAFHTALDGVSVEKTPAAWTELQRKLGSVHLKLARIGDGGPAADAAVETFDRLLATYDKDTESHKVGEAYEGRAEAQTIKARASEGDASEDLQAAIGSYREALGTVDKSLSPLLWARLQSRIGDALAFAGGQADDQAVLGEAADAYRAALEIWTPSAAPGERGRALNNLGNVLADMDTASARDDAAQCFEEAAQLFTAQGAVERATNAEWSLRRPKPDGSTRITPWTPPEKPKAVEPDPILEAMVDPKPDTDDDSPAAEKDQAEEPTSTDAASEAVKTPADKAPEEAGEEPADASEKGKTPDKDDTAAKKGAPTLAAARSKA